VPPCGCSVALHSLSCFSLPCFRSLQPTLSCNKASLITATLHFRASLRSTTLHFISPPFLSAFCSPPAALFGSPAGRYGLRLSFFICLHFVLAIKAVASCSALHAVIVFARKKGKNPASLPLPHVPSIALVPQAYCPPPLLNSQWLRRFKPSGAKKNCTLWLALLAHGCYNLPFTTHRKKKKKKKNNNVNVLTNTPKHKCKVTGLQAKADKGSLHQPQKIFLFLLPENPKGQNKKSIFWSALASLPLSLWHTGIMYSCIFRRRLAGWWLVAYTCSTVRFHFSYIGGTVPLVSIQLLWLSFSIGKLPF